jgi:class 3 adenylate cyclase/CHASE2 domain-containing sensor protein
LSRRAEGRPHLVAGALRGRKLLVAVLAVCGVWFLYSVALRSQVAELELIFNALRFRMRGEVPLAPEIRVLGLSEQFIQVLGELGEEYPLDRDLHALVLRRLADAGARVVMVDILFSEAGTWDEANDSALRDAILYCRERGCEVILAAALETGAHQDGLRSETLVGPAPLIMEAEPRLGASNTNHKLGYKLRELVELDIADLEGGPWQTQAVATLLAVSRQAGDAELEVLARLRERGPSFIVNYTGAPVSSHPLQLYELGTLLPEAGDNTLWERLTAEREAGVLPPLEGAEAAGAAAAFDGSIVFIGSRAPQDNDYFMTPFGQMYGVETITQSFDTLLRERFITPLEGTLANLVALALALLAWGLSLLRPLKLAALLGVTTAVLIFVGCVLLFIQARIDTPQALLTLNFAIPFISCMIYGGVAEEAERRRIRETFGRYMSDELVSQLVDNPKLADLGGQRMQVAVMFSDIRGYSTLTEHLDPHQTVSMLNTYLGTVTEVVRSNEGFVDKYMGDGLLACFGGPVPTTQPARDAVNAALQMVAVLRSQINPELSAQGFPELRIGIGIHYGEVVMGNIGSQARMDFTVVGDSVNVAARVEGCTKEFGWAVLVTREVVEQCGAGYDFAPVGEQKVKGREQEVELFRVADPAALELYRL